MCVGYFLVLLDVTIVNVALPRIGAGLRTDVSGLQWVVDGYALALASLMLIGGAAGDLRGHKRVVLTGLAVFGAGSLACGVAPAVSVLVAARVVQGAGAAMLLPGTLAIISHAYPDGPGQARAIGIWAGIGSMALPAGPLLGGVLITGFGWRAIFIVNVPIVIVSFAAAVAVVRESSEAQGKAMDLRGAVLGALFLLAATFAVIQGGRHGAVTLLVVAAACAALLLAGSFLLAEWRRGESAMLPLVLFRRPVFAVANGAAGVMNFGTLGMLFVLTLFLQTVRHRSPLAVGAEMIPLFAPLAVIAPLGGRAHQPDRSPVSRCLRLRAFRGRPCHPAGGRRQVRLPPAAAGLPAVGRRARCAHSGRGGGLDRRGARKTGRSCLGREQHGPAGWRGHGRRGRRGDRRPAR